MLVRRIQQNGVYARVGVARRIILEMSIVPTSFRPLGTIREA